MSKERDRGDRRKGEPDEASTDAASLAPKVESPRDLEATTLDLGGEEFLLLTFPVDSRDFSQLTSAEQEVASELLSGRSYQDIARLRGTTYGTVANQVRSIFRKLEVRSRTELARSALSSRKA